MPLPRRTSLWWNWKATTASLEQVFLSLTGGQDGAPTETGLHLPEETHESETAAPMQDALAEDAPGVRRGGQCIVIAIYKRELGAYFHSMTGYICAAFLIFSAWASTSWPPTCSAAIPAFPYALNSSLFIFMLTTPILTMRSMAEDRRNKTDQLLLTSPISITKVVLGQVFRHADGAGPALPGVPASAP